jgi:hypothetical protein
VINTWRALWLGDQSQLIPERLWLLLGIIWITGLTLAPFDISIGSSELRQSLKGVFWAGESLEPPKFAGHLVSFCVLGFIARANFTLKISFRRLLGLGILGCFVLETAQFLQFGRHARVMDVALNVAGFAGGLWLAQRYQFGERWRKMVQAHSSRPVGCAIVVAAAGTAWWVMGLQPILGGLRMNWVSSYPLIVGNEIGGARAWLGQLGFIRIYDHALNEVDVRNAYGTMEQPQIATGPGSGLLVGYDFRDATARNGEYTGSLKDPQLCLTVPTDWISKTGLTTSRSGLVQSRGAATTMVEAITRSGAFSVEVTMQPQDMRQVGPARIVSNSSGAAQRNFTLGQANRDLVFRVRNDVNSPNGNGHELTAHGIVDTGRQHVVATYDHGVSTIFRNAQCRASVDLREPIFYSGLATGPLARVALVAFAVLTISLPSLFVFRRIVSPVRSPAASLGFTALIGLAPYMICCVIGGGPIRIGFVVLFLVGLMVLFPIGVRLISQRRALA